MSKQGINLEKGSTISLLKFGKQLDEVCIGLNWGAIPRQGLLGWFGGVKSVDLDGSVAMFNASGELIDKVYYSKLVSNDASIRHSGDDRAGDLSRDDELDNEVIQISLLNVAEEVRSMVFFLNSYKQQDFSQIPYSKIRIYEGNRKEVVDVFASFNLSADSAYAGKVAMVMGKLIRKETHWDFSVIGEPIDAQDLGQSLELIQSKYV